ncbi:MAG TPA: LysR family transcriptional regulator [Firmicutes bacterium]|nr:LysR family transcriptional regulator [Bacillota bacterium]
MNLNQLYYFRTVAHLQHFRQAAQELNISQPSLSYAISSLEDELGTYLFEKQGRNVVLTKYGKLYLEYVEQALDTLELGEKKLRQVTSSSKGHIDLGYIAPLATTYIPRKVREFLQIDYNHGITFSFRQGISNDLISGLKTSKYDLVFCSYVENEPDISFELLIEDEMIVVVPFDHPLAQKDVIELNEIAPYPLVVYGRETALGKTTQQLFDLTKLKPNIICEAEGENSIYGLVAEGFGVGLAAMSHEIHQYELKHIKVNHPECRRRIYLAHKKNVYLAPAVKKFIQYIHNTDQNFL